jgi:hypothetical protein
MQKKQKTSIEAIEKLAAAGKDVSKFFGTPKLVLPKKSTDVSKGAAVQKINIDLGMTLLRDLDSLATELNISRQAVIKMMLKRSMDDHFLARKARSEHL